ncbi:proteasome subunit beta [Candidatus Woesearchaeota archaeon]|nr:MAG: proteasome subunit beta [Candidatus Woesearchaeota archaeon]
MSITVNESMKTGTTTVGIIAKDAVVLAADMRATAGNFIANKHVKKVLPVTDTIAITTAGSVSDIQLLAKYLRSELQLQTIRTGRAPTVKETANLLSGWVYGMVRRMIPSVTHFLLGGYDKKPGLYDIYMDGSLSEAEDFVASGSGSLFAYGVLETNYKKDLTSQQAVDLAVKAINAALQRDSASGGGVIVAVVDKQGYREVLKKTITTTI